MSGRVSMEALRERDGGRCWICLEDEGEILGRGDRLTRDHVIPKSLGGRNVMKNMRLACGRCNLLRGARAPHKIIPGRVPGKRVKGRNLACKSVFDGAGEADSAAGKRVRRALREKAAIPLAKLGDVARGVESLTDLCRRLGMEEYARRYYFEVGRLGD